MTRVHSNAFIALGGNLPSEVGNPAKTLTYAIKNMCGAGLTLDRVSRFFRTPSFPDGTAPEYVNAAICVTSNQSAGEILQVLHQIEHRFGRVRVQRWGMRTLDLDLLAVDQQVLPDHDTFRIWCDLPRSGQTWAAPDQLILPHPRLQDRAFVLLPLLDIAPEWVHPVLGQTVREMCERLLPADVEAVRAI